jgi:hypothetical protein
VISRADQSVMIALVDLWSTRGYGRAIVIVNVGGFLGDVAAGPAGAGSAVGAVDGLLNRTPILAGYEHRLIQDVEVRLRRSVGVPSDGVANGSVVIRRDSRVRRSKFRRHSCCTLPHSSPRRCRRRPPRPGRRR